MRSVASGVLSGFAVVWSDACLRHDGACGTWVGVEIDGDELPERTILIRDELVSAGATVVEAVAHDDALVDAYRARRALENETPVEPFADQVR